MREHNISRTKFAQLSDEELDSAGSNIKAEHPHVGEEMLNGHLLSRDIGAQWCTESVSESQSKGLKAVQRANQKG